MRSATRALIVAAAVASAAGCGNYSTEDLRFLAALPYRQDLTVRLPANTGTGPAALTGLAAASLACPTIGDADVWKWAKPTSDNLNAGVSWIIGLIDNVRRFPPTHRDEDARRWGPFDDDKHPGREIQIVMERSWPGGSSAPPSYAYRFEARVKGTTAFTPLLFGTFVGPSASHGDGDVTLDFQAFWDVGVNDADTPHGSMAIVYSRSSDPVTTGLDLSPATNGPFGVASFKYLYSGWADGMGAFAYKFTDVARNVLEVTTGYDATGAGRLRVSFTRFSDGLVGSFDQCWDAGACLVYVKDPLNFTGYTPIAPYIAGDVNACAALPAGVGPDPWP